MKALFAWLGETDVKAAKANAGKEDMGPIARVATNREFDLIVLLNAYTKEDGKTFSDYLRNKTKTPLKVRLEKLTSPTDYADIYRSATKAVEDLIAEHGEDKASLTFHISPGTGAMQTIWILMSPKYRAKLVKASIQGGVEDANMPFDIAAEFIPSMIRQRVEEHEEMSAALRPDEPNFKDIIGRSEVMQRLRARAKQAAPFPDAVLIEGPSGTGKELLARAIYLSSAHDKAFEVVNCGAIPEALAESHFFGHVKGSFTGAVADHAGYFERANGGTVFLDEVGELPLEAQAKLLRVLQDRKVQRVGGSKVIPLNVRVIAATNRNLQEEVAQRRFREDLYFRLAVLVLRTPPLKERSGDVGLLLNTFLDRLNEKKPPSQRKVLSPAAKQALLNHSWPGNVRELEAVMTRLFVWSGKTIEEADVHEAIVSVPKQTLGEGLLNRPIGNGFKLQSVLDEVAGHYMTRALAETNKVVARAAPLVGIEHANTFKSWLKMYSVKPS